MTEKTGHELNSFRVIYEERARPVFKNACFLDKENQFKKMTLLKIHIPPPAVTNPCKPL